MPPSVQLNPSRTPLSNREIGAVFAEMAELLAIQGGEPHRVRAFRQAAKAIEYLPQPAERMLHLGDLQKVQGIGDGTLHRVKQILRTGTTDDLERLRARLPAGLRDLMQLKGLGPRKVRMFYQHLGIASIEQLEMAARTGRLLQLPRFSVDAAHSVLQEIEHFRRRRSKTPLVEALRITGAIAEQLRETGATLDVVAGGSCRRRKALIGDLDMLACAEHPGPLVERFANLAEAAEVLSAGEESASVRLVNGVQADLWVFPPESWGAGLHTFSGSQQHVVALRTRAGRMGLHISEHGVSRRSDDVRLTTGRHEEEIFAAVGLPFIVPELRQNLGEMELAEQGRLPRLITAEDLRGDLHLHTHDSDGSGSAQDMARAAIELGYEYLAITDHSAGLSVAGGLDAERLARQGEQLRRLEQQLGGLHLLAGIEVDILPDGDLDLPPAALQRLDWVVASVHDHLDQPREVMTARLVKAMESGLVDCIGHPTGRKLGRRDGADLDFERVFSVARRMGVAMEINGSPARMDLPDLACRQAREMGVMLTIDTDAHSPAHLARREYGLANARRAWLEPQHVLNAQPVETVRAWRRDRLRRGGIAVPARLEVVEAEFRRVEVEVVAEPEKPAPTDKPIPNTISESGSGLDLGSIAAGSSLPRDLRERLQAFLAQGQDLELEEALERLGQGNAVQAAFNLLQGS